MQQAATQVTHNDGLFYHVDHIPQELRTYMGAWSKDKGGGSYESVLITNITKTGNLWGGGKEYTIAQLQATHKQPDRNAVYGSVKIGNIINQAETEAGIEKTEQTVIIDDKNLDINNTVTESNIIVDTVKRNLHDESYVKAAEPAKQIFSDPASALIQSAIDVSKAADAETGICFEISLKIPFDIEKIVTISNAMGVDKETLAKVILANVNVDNDAIEQSICKLTDKYGHSE